MEARDYPVCMCAGIWHSCLSVFLACYHEFSLFWRIYPLTGVPRVGNIYLVHGALDIAVLTPSEINGKVQHNRVLYRWDLSTISPQLFYYCTISV